MLADIIFFTLAGFMLLGTLSMIVSKQTLFSGFGFLVAMIALAGLFALLGQQFLAVAQIMVSVGAIVVLSILTIVSVNAKEENLPKEPYKYGWILLSTLIISPFSYLLYQGLKTLPNRFADMPVADTKRVGAELFSHWVLPFEILSILLLVAMLGAILIARKKERHS